MRTGSQRGFSFHSKLIEQQTRGKGYVKVNAQDIGFANSSFKINQALNDAAAWGHWREANDNTQQTAQQVGTDTQFQGILRTSGCVGCAKSDQSENEAEGEKKRS
ncbi:hypothetical protein SLA2020_499240 [Shorea laevis]